MKNYRKLVPLVLVLLLVLSWYMLISDSINTNKQYNIYLSEARKHAAGERTKYAMENYSKALEIKDSIDLYVEVADYYKAQGMYEEYLSWCENFFELHPTEKKAFDCVLEAYLLEEDYGSCFDVLEIAEKRGINSEYIEQIKKKIAYYYKIDYENYEDVGIYSNNYCAVKKDGLWGYVDRYGNQRINCKYNAVGAYTQSNFTSVVNSEGESYFIDKTGAKVITTEKKYLQFGLLVNDKIVAQKTDGKYVYIDQNGKELFGDYDYASTFNNGIAAVKEGEDWFIINEEGKKITKTPYEDIKLDEKQIACRNDCYFAKTEKGYALYDKTGKQIEKNYYEEVRVFASDSFAAVKINDKWGYIDKKGKFLSDKRYEEARSFSNGLAAVKIDGKWGFIDESEKVQIEPEFSETKDFNEIGSCFVNTGDKWQLLKLYRLNR